MAKASTLQQFMNKITAGVLCEMIIHRFDFHEYPCAHNNPIIRTTREGRLLKQMVQKCAINGVEAFEWRRFIYK